jgi:flagellin
MEDHFRRLSSGLRIARAADDPGALGVAERLRVRGRSTASAQRNVDDGLGLVRLAVDGLSSVMSAVARLEELALRAMNGTVGPLQMALLEVEWHGLTAEIKRLGVATVFNGIQVLGKTQTIRLQVGTELGETVRVRTFNISRAGGILDYFDLSGPNGPQGALKMAKRVQKFLVKLRGDFASTESRLTSVGRTLESARIELAAAESRVRDLDLALEMAEAARDLILQASAVAVHAQAGVDRELALEVLESALVLPDAEPESELEAEGAGQGPGGPGPGSADPGPAGPGTGSN